MRTNASPSSHLAKLLLLGPLTAPLAAQEHVPNPGFEQATGCPAGPGELSLAAPWAPPSVGSSDYFHVCNTTPDSTGIPSNAVGNQATFEGQGYAGMIVAAGLGGVPDYREYLQSPLVAPGLDADKTYRFKMQLSLAEDSSVAIDRIGVHFSATAPTQADYLVMPLTAQLETPTGLLLTDTVEWYNYTDTFVATGIEQWVTIGNFRDYLGTTAVPAAFGPAPPLQMGTAYYYVDLVSVQCEPCLEPPSDMSAWWPLDETSGLTAQDVVSAVDGLHVDGPVPMPGYVDMHLDFLSSAVSVDSAPPIELGTLDFTLDAWVRPDALGVDQALLAKIPSVGPATGPGYGLALLADGTLEFTMVDDLLGEVVATSSAALTPGTWSHVSVTVDRDSVTGGMLHVDGAIDTFDPTPAAGSLSNTLPLLFARDGGSGLGADLMGGLDEIEVFHRALAISEVVALQQSRTSGKCKTVLEIEPVTGVPVGPPTVITVGTLTTSTGSGGPGVLTGTFTSTVAAAPPGTKHGVYTSNVAGPRNGVILSPQPLQVTLGDRVPLKIQLDVPRDLGPGDVACFEVTTTHLETGRRFTTRGALRGRQPRPGRPGTTPGEPVELGVR